MCYFPCYCNGMKGTETRSTTQTSTVGQDRSHGGKFSKVLDGRKQAVRGLWERNGRFYYQMALVDAATGQKAVRRVALKTEDGQPAATIAQAREAMERLRGKRAEGDMPITAKAPGFSDYADRYLESIQAGQGAKKRSTVINEVQNLRRWKRHLGAKPLTAIRKPDVTAFLEKRRKEGIAPRTSNLDLIVLRNVLNRAKDDGYLKHLPTEGLKTLKVATPARRLYTVADIESVCAAGFRTKPNADGSEASVTKNAQQLADFLRLLSACGARYEEALHLRWQDVDFERGQLLIGWDGDTKNHEARHVDFNPKLRAHLADMHARRAPDSQWLFPSPQRGETDQRAKTFRESLKLARAAAGLPGFGFHDCRHHFISYCVMANIDFMTIARWVGHKDGGVLIGKVYGHLADEHRRAMAAKLEFPANIVSLNAATNSQP